MQKMFTHFDYSSIISEEKKLRHKLSEASIDLSSELNFNPKEETIKNILNYAAALDIKESKLVEQIEYVSN